MALEVCFHTSSFFIVGRRNRWRWSWEHVVNSSTAACGQLNRPVAAVVSSVKDSNQMITLKRKKLSTCTSCCSFCSAGVLWHLIFSQMLQKNKFQQNTCLCARQSWAVNPFTAKDVCRLLCRDSNCFLTRFLQLVFFYMLWVKRKATKISGHRHIACQL